MQNQSVAQCPLLILRNGTTGNRLDSPDHETMVTLINYRFSPSNNRARGDRWQKRLPILTLKLSLL